MPDTTNNPSSNEGAGYGSALSTGLASARETATALGIDPSGLSSRQIHRAVEDRKKADNEMGEFIKRAIANVANPNKVPAGQKEGMPQVKEANGQAEVAPPKGIDGGRSKRTNSIPIRMFCWKEGVVGTITFNASADFEEFTE